MQVMLTCFLLLARPSYQQISIDVDINGNVNTTLQANQLSVQLNQANLQQGTISSISSEILLVDICPTGTFSSVDGSACVPCPSGTASPVEGASNAMTCSACNAGTFASPSSSVCINCPSNTFSSIYMAANVSQCSSCPSHSTAPVSSDQVEACVCDDRYFVSNNLLSSFDGIFASLGFEGAASINVAHVLCQVF